jgi:uncharacterized protein
MAARLMTAIETPCQKICLLDAGRDNCVGCGRTRLEIASWMSMTPAERRDVMQQLPARMKLLADNG